MKVFKNNVPAMSPQFDGLANGCNHLALNEAGESGQSVSLLVENPNNDKTLIYYDVNAKSFALDYISPSFNTTWNIVANNETLVMPTVSTGTYDCEIDWGDGTITNPTSYDHSGMSHEYVVSGEYEVVINGTFSYFKMWGSASVSKLISVGQLGDMSFESFEDSLAPAPNLSFFSSGRGFHVGATSSNNMFGTVGSTAVPLLTIDLVGMDTSNIIDMGYMFYTSYATVIDVSSLDTSSVTHMHEMFRNTVATTIDVSSFDTSNVTHISSMFKGAKATIIDVSGFNTNNVQYMGSMFMDTVATTIDVSSFDTSNVQDMGGMFNGAKATVIDVSGFDTSNISSTQLMFANTVSSTIDVSGFYTPLVDNMEGMFLNSQVVLVDMSGWNTQNVTSMNNMFENTIALASIDLSGFVNPWSMPRSTAYMFNNACTADCIINFTGFDVSSVTNMTAMFSGCRATVIDVTNFDTSNVTTFASMFSGITASVNPSSWDISSLTDASGMFANGSGMTTAVYDALILNWHSQLTANDGPYNIVVDFGTSQYTLGGDVEFYRNDLFFYFNWTIADGGGI